MARPKWECKKCHHENNQRDWECVKCGHEPVAGRTDHELQKWEDSHKREES